MKKFTFRLQTVLNMRKQVLREKQREMAEIVKMLNIQNEKLDDLISKKQTSRDSLEAIYSSNDDLDLIGISNYKNYIVKVINDIRNQENVVKNTQNILLIKQKEVNAALKDVKIFEKLKEKQEKKFYDEFAYAQAKEIDDIASTRYNRQSA